MCEDATGQTALTEPCCFSAIGWRLFYIKCVIYNVCDIFPVAQMKEKGRFHYTLSQLAEQIDGALSNNGNAVWKWQCSVCVSVCVRVREIVSVCTYV